LLLRAYVGIIGVIMRQHLIEHTLLAAAFIMLASLPALAQNYPSAEVSGGFSYLHVQGGGNLYGWDASVTGNLNTWFGVAGEFSGHYGSNGIFTTSTLLPAPAPPTTLTVSSGSSVYTFLFGPRLSYRRDRRITPFGHVLPGFARSAFSVTVSAPGFSSHTSGSSTAFAMALGGGIDVRLSRSFAFRMIQADYLLTHFGGANQNNARITTGLVYRF
jgi:hypothetical protein